MKDDEGLCQLSPLNDSHEALGGKLAPFAGWMMPVQYTSMISEHEAVRKDVGVFDISHMGQFFISGPQAKPFLNIITTNNVFKLKEGGGQYSMILNEEGGVIDDLILYRTGKEEYLLVVNASKVKEVSKWIRSQMVEDVFIDDRSAMMAGMAVQGPRSPEVFSRLFLGRTLPARNGVEQFDYEGDALIVCRTGYTGEDGFELFCRKENARYYFENFVNGGVKPCGLGARDSLRLEVGYPLNGSDLLPDRTPLEAGLGFFVDFDKGPFVGEDELRKQKLHGLKYRLTAIQYDGKGAPPRAGYEVCNLEEKKVSELTSGVLSPSLKIGIGLAYMPEAYRSIGTELLINVRGRYFAAKVVKKPFYKG